MTDPTPAPEGSYPAAERLGPDLLLEPVHQPKAFTGPREGQGRWVILYGLGGVQLGYLWSTDTGLGFVPSSDAGIARLPEFYTAFQQAAAVNADPADVFDAWADRDGQALYAGPVTEGDVATLPA
jgi:hypothetical protein